MKISRSCLWSLIDKKGYKLEVKKILNRKKLKTRFVCRQCGAESLKWHGQCPHCGEWNSLIEESITPLAQTKFSAKKPKAQPTLLDNQKTHLTLRTSTGIKELDRVLGGGLVPGAYILLGGAPGIGKSTLLLQMAEGFSKQKAKIFYVSAEESAEQTSLRAKRLHLKQTSSIFILNETSLENIFHHAEKLKISVLIIDSIQTISTSDLLSAPGSISQVRECAGQLMQWAKRTGTAVFVIGHITKDGQLAGPRLLEHLVDTALSFEGDPHYPFRLLRALKNRFGAVNELGVFQMSSKGLQEVPNPSELFLEARTNSADKTKKEHVVGSVVWTAMEGSRPLLCEIQALTLRSYLSMPRRTALGLDINRLHMIVAVLDRYLKMNLSQCDIFLNLAGGLKITEPSADLAIAKALISAKKQVPIERNSCFFGELGLTGEIRACTLANERIKEAGKLGFKNIYLPYGNKKSIEESQNIKANLHWVSSVQDLMGNESNGQLNR